MKNIVIEVIDPQFQSPYYLMQLNTFMGSKNPNHLIQSNMKDRVSLEVKDEEADRMLAEISQLPKEQFKVFLEDKVEENKGQGQTRRSKTKSR